METGGDCLKNFPKPCDHPACFFLRLCPSPTAQHIPESSPPSAAAQRNPYLAASLLENHCLQHQSVVCFPRITASLHLQSICLSIWPSLAPPLRALLFTRHHHHHHRVAALLSASSSSPLSSRHRRRRFDLDPSSQSLLTTTCCYLHHRSSPSRPCDCLLLLYCHASSSSFCTIITIPRLTASLHHRLPTRVLAAPLNHPYIIVCTAANSRHHCTAQLAPTDPTVPPHCSSSSSFLACFSLLRILLLCRTFTVSCC